MLLCTHLATIKLLLVGLYSYYDSDFTEDVVVKFIQSFSKTIEHKTVYLANLLKILRKTTSTSWCILHFDKGDKERLGGK